MAMLERPDPPYLQIAAQIRSRIESGELQPGDAAPSAREIQETWQVASATASKVLRTLRAEGLVTSEFGKRSVVARRLRGPQQYARSVLRRGRIYPEGHYAVIGSAELVEAPDHVADILGIAPRAHTIRRERVTYGPDDRPLSRSVSWFDGALADQAPLLLQTGRIVQGTTQYIAEATGRERSPHEQAEVLAAGASEEDAQALGVEPGSPVLRGRNWYWDTDGQVLEYGESTSPAGVAETFEYVVEGEQ